MIVATADGTFEVDLETQEVTAVDVELEDAPQLALNLPRVVAASSAGPTVVAVVDAKPPMLVSYDSAATWREAGHGLPPGVAVAIDELDPDTIVFAARNRLYLSRDGGVFWTALAVELPRIRAVAF